MASVSKIQSQSEAREYMEEQEALRRRAARQAAANLNDDTPAPTVKARVLPMGDGKVSMGVHVAGIGEAYYDKGETVDLPQNVAEVLEARGYVEINTVSA